MNDSEHPGQALDWQAFQYICGDLPADAVERFERRLEHDQAARQAVARAVELAEAVVLAEAAAASPVSLSPPRTPRVWRWLAAGVAACLALLLLYYTVQPDSQVADTHDPAAGPGPAPAAGVDSAELAQRWVTSGDFLASPRPPLDEHDEALSPLFDGEADFVADPAPPLEAPSWMLAGVAHLAGSQQE